ncbi:MAG TPA: hypothetical protein VK658_27175 [Chryseolinea sp.]|nr:hypothetical protein [Chryseolinea sp.]
MASILPGYEYDIFISCRQKDNRSDRWVTSFVKALADELDATFKEDASLLEKEIGGVLRPVDFIYREPGVNRPLRLADDRSLNLEKTDYKNQVNKIANAILEIVRGLGRDDKLKPGPPRVKLNPIAKDEATNTAKSIVVLPFENMSNDPDQEYFSDGLTEEIIADLSKLSSLHVISRMPAMVFKGSKKDVRTIGQELNVRYVLEGSVRKAGNKLRITAQLIDATNDSYLRAEKFNGVLRSTWEAGAT